MMKNLLEVLNKINDKIGFISSFLILFLILLVSLSVILIYVFSVGFFWLQDLYICNHAIFILLGISYSLKVDEHVRIDLLYRSFSNKKKKIVNFLGIIVFGIPLPYLLLINGWDYFLRSFNLNESSKESGGLPNVFILKFFIFFLGFLLFLEVLRQILNFFKKND